MEIPDRSVDNGTGLADRLDTCVEYSCIFKLVKESVAKTLGKARVGLILGISDLPSSIGAFHQLGSNFIVMNKRLLGRVQRTGDRHLINSYVFHILLHEYIHSLGFVDESHAQALSYHVSEQNLGESHLSTGIAREGLMPFFSRIGGSSVFDNDDRDAKPGERGFSMGPIDLEDIEKDDLNYFG